MDARRRQDGYGAREHGEMARGGVVVRVLAAVTLCVAFTLVGAVTGDVAASGGAMLVVALGVCVGLPVGLAVWLRHVAAAGRAPRVATVVLVVNVVALGVLGGLAWPRCQEAIRARGAWWMVGLARAAGAEADGQLIRGLRRVEAAVADAMEGTQAGGGMNEAMVADGHGDGGVGESVAEDLGVDAVVNGTSEALEDDGNGLGGQGSDSDGATRGRESSPRGSWGASDGLDSESWTGDEGEGERTRVTFERHGSAIVVPVVLYGPELSVKVKMLFDTGATYSTINGRTLGELGLFVTPSDPTVMVQTANGRVRRTITTIDGAALGGGKVLGGLTVALCEECASGDVMGLLGLSYSRHFLVTVDHAAGKLDLTPKQPDPGHLYDIKPFVALTDGKGVREGDRFDVSVALHNRSPRQLRNVRIEAHLHGPWKPRLSTEVGIVAPRSRRIVRFGGKIRGRVTGFRLELQHAQW